MTLSAETCIQSNREKKSYPLKLYWMIRPILSWCYWKFRFMLGWPYWKFKKLLGRIHCRTMRLLVKIKTVSIEIIIILIGYKKKLALISISDYCHKESLFWKVVFPAEIERSHKLNAVFITECEQHNIRDIVVNVPPIYIFEVKNAIVYSKSDFIFNAATAIHSDSYDPARYSTYEEMTRLVRIIPDHKNIILKSLRKPKRNIEVGILLISAAGTNWAHWLTETLPKLCIIDQESQYKNLPLIIDNNIPLTVRESISILNRHKREIIKIDRAFPIHVSRAICISPTAIVPFGYRATKFKDIALRYEDVLFSGPAIRQLRTTALKTINPTSYKSVPTKKIYIKRTGDGRKIKNIEMIENILQNKGYEFIMPEKLSFVEQVTIFQEAKMIVGQAGAGLMNMIFSPAGCKMLVLGTYTPHSNYYYFSMVADILCHDLQFVFGEMLSSSFIHPAFQDFAVDIQKFESCLEKFEKEFL